ncbi:hypothetical protein GCM10010400_10040 [Streptomyces aculeolatus]|uniref:hypothetical protein n=1 Tax=Streptomyces aculeolatus TaxID=270689 RepID=UPI001CECC61E|nr:hypothetical protein [Streptomyces aculeolatus]
MDTFDESPHLHRAVFQRINAFHGSSREDLGVSDRVTYQQHPRTASSSRLRDGISEAVTCSADLIAQ